MMFSALTFNMDGASESTPLYLQKHTDLQLFRQKICLIVKKEQTSHLKSRSSLIGFKIVMGDIKKGQVKIYLSFNLLLIYSNAINVFTFTTNGLSSN